MGVPKASRKGKKAWRANISSKEVDDFFEKSGREERTGGPLASLSNDSLFFLDKSKDAVTEKKTRRHQEKILHCDSILQRQSLVPTLPEPRKRKAKHGKRGSKILSKRINSPLTSKNVGHVENFRDIWSSEDETCTEGRKKLKKCTPMVAPAVEVDAPGCSYNPSKEDHQDALALAVAEEMQKAYKKELEPTPAPHFVDGMPIEEEERYFIEADNGDDGEEEEGEEEGLDLSKGQRLKKKLTRAERNRKARRRAELKLEGTKKQRASIQKDVARVDEILDDIKIDEEHKKKRWLRRTTAKKEKCAQAPPKLGKHKFQPEPVQVLLTEEVTGSLRKLKGCYSLSRERFKSLQRRGIIEPRIPLKRRSRRKRITYVEGTKGQLEREMHAAAEARRAARKLPKPAPNDEMISLISAAGS